MTKTYSQLVYRQIDPVEQDATDQRTIVALHGDRGELEDLLPLARRLGPGQRIVAPEAARGVYAGLHVVSRTWFGGSRQRPEPASFGDSLAQLERFMYDVRARQSISSPASPWLLGYDQGAVLALSIGIIAPDLIGGVMAICGGLPMFSDPKLLDPIESDLPVLLIGDCANRTSEEAVIETTERRLAQLGHQITVRWIEGAAKLGDPVTHELRNWLQDHPSR
jgi:predicted esterase